jgi:hypothetical protein
MYPKPMRGLYYGFSFYDGANAFYHLTARTSCYHIDYFPEAIYFAYIPVDNHPDRFNATSNMIDLQEITLLPKRFIQPLFAQSPVRAVIGYDSELSHVRKL